MAYIAFDLDNTLGFFEITNPLAHFWSPEFINNTEQKDLPGNSNTLVSPRLEKTLQKVRERFAKLLADDPVLPCVLRPNHKAMFEPILQAKKHKKLRSVIIYSNTSHHPSMFLAKDILEKIYKAKGLFAYCADAWDRHRARDRVPYKPGEYVEPLKQLSTLKHLFQVATHSPRTIPTTSIAFVDDRRPKHTLEKDESDGLCYIVPTHYRPMVKLPQKKRILELALQAMDDYGVLNDEEYLRSGFCFRDAPIDWPRKAELRGFPDLLAFVWDCMKGIQGNPTWEDDGMTLRSKFTEFFRRFT
jgi:hypothetical protein